jgi:hypothetical protein
MGSMSKSSALFFVLISLMALTVATSQPALADSQASRLQWSKTFGYLSAYSIAQTSDGGFLIAAQEAGSYDYVGHLGFNYNNVTGVLLKIDPAGNLLWSKTLPLLPTVMVSTDGGFVIGGEVNIFFGYGETDLASYPIYQSFSALLKIDVNGNSLWNQTYNLPGQPMQMSNQTEPTLLGIGVGANVKFLAQTNDGGFVFGGTMNLGDTTFNPFPVKAWLIRTDPYGDSLWNNTYGLGIGSTSDQNDTERSNTALSIVQTADGGFLFVGDVDGAALIKIDAVGRVQWMRDDTLVDYIQSNHISNYTQYNSITKTEDGGCILVGFAHGGETTEPYLEKLDAGINQVWNRTYNVLQYAFTFAFRLSATNGYFFSSASSLVKTDLAGNLEWVNDNNGTINSMIQTSDGGYALAGLTASSPGSEIETTYIWIAKLNSLSGIPEFPTLIILPLLLCMFSVAVILEHRKTSKFKKV